jgi:hypothetical protein
MPNKKISEFPTTPTLMDDDIFLINHMGSTSTVNLSTIANKIASTVNYTTVGNASAGIFVDATVYQTPNQTGTWRAPAGCHSARVTLVGGSVVGITKGTASRFNYPSGTTPQQNQGYADGGSSNGLGGDAAWNGVKFLGAIGTPAFGINGYAGEGGCAAGGCGGGGGGVGDLMASGGSWGGSGDVSTPNSTTNRIGAGGSGGVNGNGGRGGTNSGGAGAGRITLSYKALLQLVATTRYGYGAGGGAGWCTFIVSTTPGQDYSYTVGSLVVIEW